MLSPNYFKKNATGRDFVVGDIHGCFRKLSQALDDLGFDSTNDRLFSVGDLVDRGPNSHESLDWLAQPWFHAVRGNHEQMAIDAVNGQYEPATYIFNGGKWFLDLPQKQRECFANAFSSMPLWVTVEVEDGIVGIVHGDAPTDWEFVDKIHEHHLMWGRQRYNRKDETPIANVLRVYSGHTPVKQKKIYGNQHFIDTGAVFGGPLTIERIN